MATHTITITNCVPDPLSLPAHHNDEVIFRCGDNKTYEVKGLNRVLDIPPGNVRVTPNSPVGPFKVIDRPHVYSIVGPGCHSPTIDVPPDIIIDN